MSEEQEQNMHEEDELTRVNVGGEEPSGLVSTEVPEDYRVGFVAVVGKPNVGKSTLVNQLVGQKVTIVSPKPQTTRRQVMGILTTEEAQVVFVDTPGIHLPRTKLGEFMVESAKRAVPDADLNVFVCDVSKLPDQADHAIAEMLNQGNSPVLLVLNKMDRLPPEKVEAHTQAYWNLVKHDEWMMTTATRGVNVDKLNQLIFDRLPFGVPYFPEDQVTDQSERMFASELIREKVLYKTRAEVPHAVAVVIEQWENRPNDTIYVAATIYVEKESQKGILIGNKGAMLKQIGQMAREELEEVIESRVFLELWVKVRENWRQSANALRSMEYRLD